MSATTETAPLNRRFAENLTASYELPYQARARLADNLLVQRQRAGYSQRALAERASLTPEVIRRIEDGKVASMLDTYVRLAGALSVTLDGLLAGVLWTPPVVEMEQEAGYRVEFEVVAPPGS